MSKILLYSPEYSPAKFESFKDAFVELSTNGFIVKSLSDGIIETNKGTIEFCRLATENLRSDFIEDISDYRDDLRASFSMLKKQGIPMPQSTVKALKEQLSFMDNEDSSTSEEAPVEEAPVEEAPVEEAPVEEAPVEKAENSEEQDTTEEEMPSGIID